MKYNYMYILKSLRTSLLLMVMVLSCSCSNEENSAPHKGATLPIMQGIADNVPYIQSVEKEAAYDPVSYTHLHFPATRLSYIPVGYLLCLISP